ncbi:hypothetical protein CDD82_7521 [Ophiocordyceps australis]|uniref:Peroxin/Ferlin domain-containing protein n=1 Tax=Ophiocordyceps australis TaxID=1399860 RepID=A0A2C5Y201_9HYPO|nr:hypothetical protein CDD82_7521 [Ophiocordyceps australis]
MAAFDSPWLSPLGLPMSSSSDDHDFSSTAADTPRPFDSSAATGLPSTFAAFSPVTLSATTPSRSARRSTVLVHQKSPLLLATPPQVTRALAYSHPFILSLNTLFGLLTWSTGDPWQSFLLLAAFWATTLYGDVVLLRAGPIALGLVFIAGMYGRRYSPLSSSGWSEPVRQVKDASASKTAQPSAPAGARLAAAQSNDATDAKDKHRRTQSSSSITINAKHQKTLDEIVETLKEFTGRCNALMEPLLELTDFLSTQRTPTSATTRPALTAMFVRLLAVTPFWLALTLPPWRIITTRRVILVAGTLVLTWHARVMRVTRTILWRSALVRRLASVITGLRFQGPSKEHKGPLKTTFAKSNAAQGVVRSSSSQSRKDGLRKAGVKFTFILYENQRRWVGLGWTASLFAYERPAWTDEHNNTASPKDDFELPAVEDGSCMRWQWVPDSRWRVDGVPDEHGPVDYDGEVGKNGWVYYDNKWQNGRRGQDGWGKWTRRRKWYRDAELVEVDDWDVPPPRANGMAGGLHTERYSTAGEKMQLEPIGMDQDASTDTGVKTAADDAASLNSTSSKASSSWLPSFRRRNTVRRTSERDSGSQGLRGGDGAADDDPSGLALEVELELQKQTKDGGQWGIGDEARMNLE